MQKQGKGKNVLRIGLTGLAIFMIILGVLSGEPRDVWSKAVRICMECIGIG